MSNLTEKSNAKVEVGDYGHLGVWTTSQVYRDGVPVGEPQRHYELVKRHNWALAKQYGGQVALLANLLWTPEQTALWDTEEAEALGVDVKTLLKPVADQVRTSIALNTFDDKARG